MFIVSYGSWNQKFARKTYVAMLLPDKYRISFTCLPLRHDFFRKELIVATGFSKATLGQTLRIFSTRKGMCPWPIVRSSYFDRRLEENDFINIFSLEQFRSNDTSERSETRCGIQGVNVIIFSKKSSGKRHRRIFPCKYLLERARLLK
jgi:hypothetical protein